MPARPLPPGAGIDEAMVEWLVRDFYGRVRQDARLGPIFMAALGDDWEPHLLRLIDFWSSLMLTSGRYSGQPLRKHLALTGVTPADFDIWLGLFRQAARDAGTSETAAAFVDKAERVARSFQMAMFDELQLGRAGRP